MLEYHKIETLFERDMEGTRKLIEGKFRSPLVEYIKDCKWIFTEKVDGTNIRIYWNGHKVTVGGRTNNAQIPAHLYSELQTLFLTNEAEQMFEQLFGEKEVYLFGEGYGTKIQSGGDYSSSAKFILFDVMVGDVFLERENCEALAKSFGIQVVPVFLEGTLDEAVKLVKQSPNSLIARNPKQIEGLIGIPAIRLKDFRGNRVIVKIKCKDFKN
jgi:ATP-dependent RNA circularization protein (DNA/RNA ligase family)